ncbi:hypothetical protein V7161_10190 [Neobacillus drentensis]|uniref:hypothetical protein n=1 Tax=Neobacillus drentensis TaxID=220684 RepID=UPI003000BABA
MVIQSNMSPKAIVEVWEGAATILKQYHVPIMETTLEAVVKPDVLPALLKDLNAFVGSSMATCVEGG